MSNQQLTNLPVPQFSTANPYWRDRRIPGVLPEYQPRNTALDFMYAATWERWRPDIHSAYCVRQATAFTVRFNLRPAMRQQVKELLYKQKYTPEPDPLMGILGKVSKYISKKMEESQ